MALFWLSMILLTVIAMLFIVWPLHRSLKNHSSLTPDQKWLVLLAIIIPLNAFVLYGILGNSNQIALSNAIEQSVMAASDQDRQEAHQTAIELLEKITQTQADNFDNWYLLGDFYMQTKQYKKAVNAFGQAISIQTVQADALAQYAQALYFAGNNKLTFAITSTVEQALKINPNQPIALGLMGITAFENNRYQEAITYWQKIISMMGEQAVGSQAAKKGIELAKNALKKQGQWVTVEVNVKIDPLVILAPSHWVWVYARLPLKTEPIAMVKVKASDLPKRIKLDNTMLMPDGIALSSATNVEIVARLLTADNQTPSEADKQAISQPILPTTQGTHIELLIK